MACLALWGFEIAILAIVKEQTRKGRRETGPLSLRVESISKPMLVIVTY
jgi:hypothetical protein